MLHLTNSDNLSVWKMEVRRLYIYIAPTPKQALPNCLENIINCTATERKAFVFWADCITAVQIELSWEKQKMILSLSFWIKNLSHYHAHASLSVSSANFLTLSLTLMIPANFLSFIPEARVLKWSCYVTARLVLYCYIYIYIFFFNQCFF